MRIGVDLLGSDTAPHQIYQGILDAEERLGKGMHFHPYGTESLQESLFHNPAFHFELVEEAILMDDNPLTAIRRKKNSSIYRGIQDLKSGKIDVFISCGNTGALVALATIQLDLLPGISRAGLLATLPTANGYTHVIDVGGSTSMNKEHLIQFTRLGVDHLRQKKGIKIPRVALLNIGTESLKGTPEHQRLYQHLKEHQEGFVFLGNTEGKQVFSGDIDLVVTDGFTGNIFLKTAEGASHFLVKELERKLTLEENRLLSPHFKRFSTQFSQSAYPGAYLLGLKQALIKCHGNTTSETIKNAIIDVCE
ncbi:hypothetical protein N9Y92_02270 [Chlamydiales bacterium]|nr:hypothetical protein [Chlamydiales bacterium]